MKTWAMMFAVAYVLTGCGGRTDGSGGSWLVNIHLTGPDEGYIIPSNSPAADRIFDNERVYLTPIPADQIKIFSDRGFVLSQNPLWQN